jgi:uncharacterized protein YecE (DUF72 family)
MIRVGVAGWDYPDWVGPVYPERASRNFDRLAYLSRFVHVLEINSTFYRPADPRTAESWLRRTEGRPHFTFTAKAHRSWTHEREPDLAAVKEAAKDIRDRPATLGLASFAKLLGCNGNYVGLPL